MSRACLLVGASLFLPAAAIADPLPPHLYFGTSLEDRTPSNPVLMLNPGETGQVHLFLSLSPSFDVNGLSVGLATPDPQLADPGPTVFVNPMISTTNGGLDRWSSVFTDEAFGSGFAQDPSPGLDGQLQLADPTFDPNTSSLYVGSF